MAKQAPWSAENAVYVAIYGNLFSLLRKLIKY